MSWRSSSMIVRASWARPRSTLSRSAFTREGRPPAMVSSPRSMWSRSSGPGAARILLKMSGGRSPDGRLGSGIGKLRLTQGWREVVSGPRARTQEAKVAVLGRQVVNLRAEPLDIRRSYEVRRKREHVGTREDLPGAVARQGGQGLVHRCGKGFGARPNPTPAPFLLEAGPHVVSAVGW